MQHPVDDHAVALAHSLAGNSATVGFTDLSHLARLLEHALTRSQALPHGDALEAALFNQAAEQIRHLLHQFAAGFLVAPPAELVARLVDHERHSAERLQAESEQVDAQDSSADAYPYTFDAPTQPAPLAQAMPEPEVAPAPDLAAEWRTVEAQDSTSAPLASPAWGRTPLPASGEPPPVAQPRRITAPHHDGAADDDEIDAVDAIDAELFPIFEEEAQELLPQLAERMRDWAARPGDAAGPAACMRTLHTLKGGARLAGAMRLGERAHRLETAIDRLAAGDAATSHEVEALLAQVDAIGSTLDILRGRSVAVAPAVEAVAMPEALSPQPEPAAPAAQAPETDIPAPPANESAPIDWKRFAANRPSDTVLAEFAPAGGQGALGAGSGTVRVRAPLLDRLVNQAGEVSITRSRIDADVSQMQDSLTDLTENLERLRHQLRDIELQAETQIGSQTRGGQGRRRIASIRSRWTASRASRS